MTVCMHVSVGVLYSSWVSSSPSSKARALPPDTSVTTPESLTRLSCNCIHEKSVCVRALDPRFRRPLCTFWARQRCPKAWTLGWGSSTASARTGPRQGHTGGPRGVRKGGPLRQKGTPLLLIAPSLQVRAQTLFSVMGSCPWYAFSVDVMGATLDSMK